MKVFKNGNLILRILPIIVIGTMIGCAKTENFSAYSDKKISTKIIPGTWDINQLEIWIVDDGSTHSALDHLVFNDPGNFEFKEGGACNFNLEAGSLDATYLTLNSTATWKWEYLSGSFSLGEHFNGNVMYLDKKEMTIHFPWSLNLYLTEKVIVGKSVEFRFKLKKQ